MDSLTKDLERAAVDQLEAIIDTLRNVPSDIVSTGDSFQSDCNEFVEKIDEADSFLY